MSQQIIYINDNCNEMDEYISSLQVNRLLLVCGSSIRFLKYDKYFAKLPDRIGVEVVRFSDFTPNPDYESVIKGAEVFRREHCDMIVAVGGGSAMDVAKCIKLFFNKEFCDNNSIKQNNNIPFMAIPTTAGTGSEVTHFAVIYHNGEKKSVSDYSCIPQVVIMDSSVLAKLPLYQKKVTMLDAFCHGVESFWSVNSTDESKEFSKKAISLILDNMNEYICIGDSIGDAAGIVTGSNKSVKEICDNMQKAAYLAGKAINITKTTAGHAMCYKLTSLYGIAHGHAAFLCVSKLFPYMIGHTDDCTDARGKQYLDNMFVELAKVLGFDNTEQAGRFFDGLISKLELMTPSATNQEYTILKTSVNTERLKNNPVSLTEAQIDELYHEILHY